MLRDSVAIGLTDTITFRVDESRYNLEFSGSTQFCFEAIVCVRCIMSHLDCVGRYGTNMVEGQFHDKEQKKVMRKQ